MDLTASIAVRNSLEPNKSLSKFAILVEFHCQTFEREVDYGDDGQFRVLTEDPESKISSVTCVDFAMPRSELKQFLLAELEDYDIKCKEFEENIVDQLYDYAQMVLKKSWDFSIVVTIEQFLDYIVDPSDEGNGLDMVPASIEAIASLPRKMMGYKIDEVQFESCTICLEEISTGSLVSTLPCSHNFHDGCILEWLKRSHYCPNCRFEMPTTEDNDLVEDYHDSNIPIMNSLSFEP